MYIQRVSDNPGSSLNEFLSEPGYFSEFVWDPSFGWMILPFASKGLPGAPTGSQTYQNFIHSTAVPVITYPSYSEDQPEYPPTVWFSPDMDTYKFTLCFCLYSPGGSQWPKYILLMQCLCFSIIGQQLNELSSYSDYLQVVAQVYQYQSLLSS